MKLELKTLGALAFASAAPALQARVHSFSDECDMPVTMYVEERVSTPIQIKSGSTEVDTDILTFERAIPIEEWTPKLEREFHKLAAKEAVGTLTKDEYARLESLTTTRNILEFPRTADEVMAELRHEEVIKSLTNAMEKYVRFRESTDKTTLRTRKKN